MRVSYEMPPQIPSLGEGCATRGVDKVAKVVPTGTCTWRCADAGEVAATLVISSMCLIRLAAFELVPDVEAGPPRRGLADRCHRSHSDRAWGQSDMLLAPV